MMDHNDFVKTPFMKRYIIEDSIPKVTSDGQPHEMMTLVAGLSGMVAAIVILAILITLVNCKHKERKRPASIASPSPGISEIPELNLKQTSILPLFSKSVSLEDTSPRLVSVSVISNGFGNLNSAFVASEMSLGPKSEKDAT